VQDALALPPIDLGATDADLDNLSILVVAPITRQDLQANQRALQSLARPVLAAAGSMQAKRSPLESLIRIAQPVSILQPTSQQQQIAAAWQTAVAAARTAADKATGGRGMFWYLRKRQLPYTSEVAGTTLRLAGDAGAIDTDLNLRLTTDGRTDPFNQIMSRLPRLAQADVVNLLATPRLALSPTLAAGGALGTSDILRRSAFTALTQASAATSETVPFDQSTVLAISRNYGDPNLGQGFDALLQAADDTSKASLTSAAAVATIESSGVAPDLDLAARQLPIEEQAGFASHLAQAAAAGNVDAVRQLVGAPAATPT